MLTSISSNEIALNVKEAVRITTHVNGWLDGAGLACMFMDPNRPITVYLNQEVMSGRVLGTTYARQFREFMDNGGLMSMIHCFDAEKARFRYGFLGSMWTDLMLTGNVEGATVQKLCRIALFPMNVDGRKIKRNHPAWLQNIHSDAELNGALVNVQKVNRTSDGGVRCVVTTLSPANVAGRTFKVNQTKLIPAIPLDEDTKYGFDVDPTNDQERSFCASRDTSRNP